MASAITLIEVVKLGNQLRLKAQDEKILKNFFKNPYIYIHNVDVEVGMIARDLIWKHNLSQRDSIHVATALMLKLKKMHTFDAQLLALDKKYSIRICEPDFEYQRKLELDEEKT